MSASSPSVLLPLSGGGGPRDGELSHWMTTLPSRPRCQLQPMENFPLLVITQSHARAAGSQDGREKANGSWQRGRDHFCSALA